MGWLYVFDVDGKKLAVYKNGDRAEVNKEILDSATYVRDFVKRGKNFLAKTRFQTWILDKARRPIWKKYKKKREE